MQLEKNKAYISCEQYFMCEKNQFFQNKPPLHRGAAATPLLCLSHEKDATHCTGCFLSYLTQRIVVDILPARKLNEVSKLLLDRFSLTLQLLILFEEE